MVVTAYIKKTVCFILSFFVVTVIFTQNEAVKTVVLDPGHGGKDPGCIGKYLKEKDVALNICLVLGKYIEEHYPNVNIIYTRDSDVFVPLDQRAKIANENNADLFISVHANAANPVAYGTETFVLGLHRSESQQKVAERENSIIHFEEDSEEKYKDFDLSPDAIIIRQMQLSVFLDQSIGFASLIQDQFEALGRKNRGVKQAGFIVLYKTTMPSVLVEAGFLTNAAEENYLRDSLNQVKMANGVFRAFQKYKSEREGVQSLIVDGAGFAETVKALSEIEEEKENEQKISKDDVVFKVQVETSKEKLTENDSRFKGYKVEEYIQDDLYKYTIGQYVNDFQKAKEEREKLKEEGFEHAFIVAFRNEERISITDALKLKR